MYNIDTCAMRAMKKQFERTRLLYGDEAMEILKSCRVAVFGIGGVGGYTVEALARSGVGALDIIDYDKVDVSNINRQIIATFSSIGKYKVDAAKERIHDINPDCVVRTYKTFYLPDTAGEFDFREEEADCDYRLVEVCSDDVGLTAQVSGFSDNIIAPRQYLRNNGRGSRSIRPVFYQVADCDGIGSRAFQGCSGLTSLELPEDMAKVHFTGNFALHHSKMPQNMDVLDLSQCDVSLFFRLNMMFS